MTPQELKSSILQLAIQGKLVEQRPEEGTGEELYRQIQAEKQRLIQAGKIKKEKPLPEIGEDEVLFEIPESWKWVRVGDIFAHNTGKAMNSSAKQTDKKGSVRKFITTSNLYWNTFDLLSVKEMFFSDDELARCTATKNDLLMCEGGAYFGRTAIWSYDYDVCFQNHIHRLRPYYEVCQKFYYYIFFFYKNMNMMKAKGTAMPGLSSVVLHEMVVPLPPLDEQKRIVAKIEELLPYLDRYEKAWNRLEDFGRRFPADMQKSILQMAIQGKLVEQRPEEGTGEALYRQIQAEKQALIKAGKIKKEKPLPEIAEDEVPFEIPESWIWIRFGQAIDMLSGFAFKSSDFKEAGRYRLLRGINLGVGATRWDDTVYVDEMPEKLEPYHIQKGDVLIGLDRPWISDGIRVTIYKDEEQTYLVQRVLRIRETCAITKEYIALLLRSNLFKNAVEGQITGISVPHISPGQVSNVVIPLPPLAEQKRIVARLEEILPLCERLK